MSFSSNDLKNRYYNSSNRGTGAIRACRHQPPCTHWHHLQVGTLLHPHTLQLGLGKAEMLSKAAFCYSHIFYCIAYGSVLALPVPSDNISIDTYFQVKEDKGQILLMTKIVLASYRLLLLVFFYHQAYVISHLYLSIHLSAKNCGWYCQCSLLRILKKYTV